MRKVRLLLLISLIISCLFAFASCDDTEILSSPTDLEIEAATLTLNWKAVAGARLYTIKIVSENGESREAIASKTYYSLTGLTAGNYTIQVKANGKDGVSRDSDWSETIPFEREKESGMTFALINDNTEYEVTSKGIATGDIVIPDTYRGLPVTSIGKKAFFNKSDVTSVVIGNNVKSIGEYAFANCSYVTSISIPEGLTTIGESAFASCRLMSGKIVIPEGVTVIPRNAFAYCVSLPEVVISDSVKRIEASAFTDCGKLASVKLPADLEYVGELAFSSCTSLQSLEFGNKLQEIGKYAFSELTSLESIVIPDSVETIGQNAFYLCEKLATVQLGNGVKQIDSDAFFMTKLWESTTDNYVYVGKWLVGCKDHTQKTITIKPDTIGVAAYALAGNTGIEVIEIPNSVQIICKGAFSKMSVHTLVLGSGVRTIGDEAFAYCKGLSTVYLGTYNPEYGTLGASNLVTIGDYAFRECAGLDAITIPSSVKSIGSYAFRNSGIFKNSKTGVVYAGDWVVDYTENLGSSIELQAGTVGIANYAFYNCKVLEAIKIPNSVKTIGRAAFYDCATLSQVTLPEDLQVIEEFTFYRCKSLQLFELPSMLTYIGRSAFYKCGSASTMKDKDTENDVFKIPSDVKYIGDNAFYSCGYSERAALGDEQYYNYYGIDSIVIAGALDYMGVNAFYSFVSLKSVDLGESTSVGERAFFKCSSLKTVDFGESIVEIGEKAFYKCEALESVELPNTLTKIGNYAFYRCDALKSLDIGESVSYIGSFAFFGNFEIKELYLPTSVTFIGKQAFRNCKGLTSVVISDSVETIEQHAFYGCSSLTLYLTSDKASDKWHKYWNSSYRPVVYGCELSEDGAYVLYVKKGTIANLNSNNSLSDPVREGYKFVGWGTNSTATVPAYTSDNLSEADNGKKLYALWIEEEINGEN